MKLADGIRKHGFRKWYERELLHSHAHLVLTFFCVIGLFAAFEALGRFRSMGDQFTNVVAILLCAGIGLWALRRYLALLMHAEVTAHQADCPGCKAYGRFKLASDTANDKQHDDHIAVCCSKCQHRWTISG
ncbi:MAG: hypothetical protein ABIQ29_00285 [Burkholderiaceae bacterium]